VLGGNVLVRARTECAHGGAACAPRGQNRALQLAEQEIFLKAAARDADIVARAFAKQLVTGDNVRQWVIVLLTALLLPTQMLGASAQTEVSTTRDSDIGPVIASLPAADAARGVSLKGLATAREGACVGMLEIVDVDGPGQSCTHGPDAAPVSIGDVRTADMTPQEAVAVAESSPPFVCDGDGISGRRVHAIYAVTPDRADRFAQYEAAFKGIIAGAQDQVRDSSSAHGSDDSLLFRFKHTVPVNGSCEPIVDHVKLSSNADDDSFGATIDALKAKGYVDASRRYLVFMDANLLCGIGQMALDDRPSPAQNWNNVLYQPMFSRVDAGCWDYAETHELAHNIGAVQDSAPHASGNGHCNDDHDLMCYADGGSTSAMFVDPACPSSTWERLLDCGGDDYFNPAPAAGSYLDTHWNIASSGWLFVEPAGTGPSAPVDTIAPNTSITSGPAGLVVSDAAKFRFSSSEAGTFECRLDNGAWTTCASPVSYTDLTNGQHQFRVRAIDSFGSRDASPASRLWTVSAPAPVLVSYYPTPDGDGMGRMWVTNTVSGSQRLATRFGTADGWQTHLIGDLDGDGIQSAYSYYPGPDGNGRGRWWTTDLVTGAQRRLTDFGTAEGWQTHLAADLDGDGVDELLSFYPGNGTWWRTRIVRGVAVQDNVTRFGSTKGWGAHLAVDVDNDGRDELASFHSGTRSWWITRFGTDGVVKQEKVFTYGRSDLVAHVAGNAIDSPSLDYDSRPELWSFASNGSLWMAAYQASDGSWVSKTTTDYAGSEMGTPDFSSHLMGDVSGDGVDDLVSFDINAGRWWITPFTGNGEGTKKVLTTFGTRLGWQTHLLVDDVS
jgi:hypothetical protein